MSLISKIKYFLTLSTLQTAVQQEELQHNFEEYEIMLLQQDPSIFLISKMFKFIAIQ